jgi:hypothetical protein
MQMALPARERVIAAKTIASISRIARKDSKAAADRLKEQAYSTGVAAKASAKHPVRNNTYF